MAAPSFAKTIVKRAQPAVGINNKAEASLIDQLLDIVDGLLYCLHTKKSEKDAQKQAYKLIGEYIAATGKVYRGCNFKTIKERDAFIGMAEKEGLTESNSTRDTQCYNGVPLSALFCISSSFATTSSGFGVVFEIDAAKIFYRPVDYSNGEECPLNIQEAEVRARKVPPDAIIAIHLVYPHDSAALKEAKRT